MQHVSAHDEKRRLASKLIPMWLRAAPRAAGKQYVKKVNSLLPKDKKRSAAALLFDALTIEAFEHDVIVPPALSGFTIEQIGIPKGTVTIIGRTSSDGKKQDFQPKAKLMSGDVVRCVGSPHDYAGIATKGKDGEAIFIKPREIQDSFAQLKAQKESLWLAAKGLFDLLLPCWRAFRSKYKALATIQARHRGRATRHFLGPQASWIRLRTRAVRMAGGQVFLEFVRHRYSLPLVDRKRIQEWTAMSRQLAPSTWKCDDENDLNEADLAHISKTSILRKSALANLYSRAINTRLAASPEGAEMDLPFSLHKLLFGGPLQTTAILHANEVTIGGLAVPSDISMDRFKVNGKSVAGGKRLDPARKLLKDDTVTFTALAHRLAYVTEVGKGTSPTLLIITKDKRNDGIELVRGILMNAAEDLARFMQKKIRSRIEDRVRAQRDIAALVLQRHFRLHAAKKIVRSEEAQARLTLASTTHGRQAALMKTDYGLNSKKAQLRAARAAEAEAARQEQLAQSMAPAPAPEVAGSIKGKRPQKGRKSTAVPAVAAKKGQKTAARKVVPSKNEPTGQKVGKANAKSSTYTESDANMLDELRERMASGHILTTFELAQLEAAASATGSTKSKSAQLAAPTGANADDEAVAEKERDLLQKIDEMRTAMAEELGQARAEKERWKQSGAELEAAVAELKRQLASKQADLKKHGAQVVLCDKRIQDVQSQYDKSLKRLQQKQGALAMGRGGDKGGGKDARRMSSSPNGTTNGAGKASTKAETKSQAGGRQAEPKGQAGGQPKSKSKPKAGLDASELEELCERMASGHILTAHELALLEAAEGAKESEEEAITKERTQVLKGTSAVPVVSPPSAAEDPPQPAAPSRFRDKNAALEWRRARQ